METSYKKVSFSPLSRGRFRCNQTGVIVSSAKTKSYKAMLLNLGKNKKRVKIYTYPGRLTPGSPIYCPVCQQRIFVGTESGVITCRNDHSIKVTVVRNYGGWR